MRAITQNTAFQIVMKNHSKEAGGMLSICVILVIHALKHVFFLQNIAACLVKVTTSHEHQMSP